MMRYLLESVEVMWHEERADAERDPSYGERALRIAGERC